MSPVVLDSKIYTKEELCLLKPAPDPCGIVIFGASGDLAHRKLFPSLHSLFKGGHMPAGFFVVGIGRTNLSDEKFRSGIREALPESDRSAAGPFLERCRYITGDYDDPEVYRRLKDTLAVSDKQFNVNACRLFYLSTPPALYPVIVGHLGDAGLAAGSKDSCWARLIVEKPFGDSLAAARSLNEKIARSFQEHQVYRIDHYLGKETVQNILMFRFANILFEPVWNRNYIDHVQITALEKLGVEHRAGYYDHAGVLRDMFQNHLLQLLSSIAMEPPTSLQADAVRDRRQDVFSAIRPMTESEVMRNTVCAQYAGGEIDGKKVPAYKDEPGVRNGSRTPTYAAAKLEIDTWRWQGVPFYLRSGKRLGQSVVEVSIHFRSVPASVFKPLEPEQLTQNILKFRIQPNEGITMGFEAKHPGPKLCLSTVTMDFGYKATFGEPPPESYARLFLDAMVGDQTLFARGDGVEESWRIMDPIIRHWESAEKPALPTYPAGSRGPSESDRLLSVNGHQWD